MTAGLRILVIDDDETDRMAIRRHLGRAPLSAQVDEAATGEEGAMLVAQGGYACVFLDYRLPDMDGIHLLRRLYDVEADTLPAPFVMMTGERGEGVMIEALRWGVHDFLVKRSINEETLTIALRKAQEIFDLKSARRTMEQALRHAQKMDAVGQLTSGIAHDFNNLLTVILGNTRLLNRRLDAFPDQEHARPLVEKVAAVETAAKKGAELVKHLMVFTRQREVKPESIDAAAAVREIYGLLQRTLGERVELKLEEGPEAAPVNLDKTLLENAIINIAVNARDAMKNGGKLTVSTAVEGVSFVVSMADTGTGMPEHVRQRIFEPFFTTKPAGEGTGLGLAMVYGFISQSGGRIDVDSEEGGGTTFRISLPLQTGEEDACQARSA